MCVFCCICVCVCISIESLEVYTTQRLWGNRYGELEWVREFHLFIHGVYSIITCQSALKKIKESTRGKGEREEKGREKCLPKNSQVQSYTRLLKCKCPSGTSCPSQEVMKFTFSCSCIFLGFNSSPSLETHVAWDLPQPCWQWQFW